MQRRTKTAPPAPPRASPASGGMILLAAMIIALAAFMAYRNTFTVPFYFDDRQAITDNDSIKHLNLDALNPPSEHVAGVIGRPLVNLSLAINYAISGDKVESYHELNLIFHVLASWLLLGVLRRTLLRSPLAESFGEAALPLAFFITLLWAMHPLLTETVTCAVQRDESMVAIFYLLAFYCFVRSVDSLREKWWQAGAIAACFLGVATKEVMVTAPLLILLYDRALVAGTFRAAWMARRRFYAIGIDQKNADAFSHRAYIKQTLGDPDGAAQVLREHGGELDSAGVAHAFVRSTRRDGRIWAGDVAVGLCVKTMRGDHPLPAAGFLAASAGARLRHGCRA